MNLNPSEIFLLLIAPHIDRLRLHAGTRIPLAVQGVVRGVRASAVLIPNARDSLPSFRLVGEIQAAGRRAAFVGGVFIAGQQLVVEISAGDREELEEVRRELLRLRREIEELGERARELAERWF